MPINLEVSMKKTIIAFVAATFAQGAIAQPPDLQAWTRIAPAIQAALECRAEPNLKDPDIEQLLSFDGDITEKAAPAGFTVFGMPVEHITLVQGEDDDERPALSATSLFAKASLADVSKAAKLGTKDHTRQAPAGTLMASMGTGNKAQISCSFAAK